MTTQFTKKQAVLLLFTIFAVSVNMRPAISSIGPMLDTIRDDLALSNAQVSLLTALPVLCMGLFASLAPFLNRTIGLTGSMYLMLLIIGGMTLLRGFTSSYAALLISAVFIGIGIAVIGPLLSSMIKQFFPDRATSVIGIYTFGMGVGATLGAGLTAVFFKRTGSYPFALGIWAALAVLGLVFCALSLRGNIRLKQKKADSAGGAAGISPWKQKKAWLFLVFFGLQASSFFCVITWVVPIATSSGMSLVAASGVLSLMTGIQIVLNLIFPIVYERIPKRRLWLLFFLTMGLISIALLSTGNWTLMWVSAVFMSMPLAGLFPISLLFPLDATETAEDTNAWTAMMQTGGYIIASFVPLLIALVYDATGNHAYTLGIFAALFIGMIRLTFLVGEREQQVG